MTRSFSRQPIDQQVIRDCIDLGLRAPSAGKSQGWNVLLFSGDQTSQYWNIALPEAKRTSFGFPGLLQAPCVALMLADSRAYLQRYSEPDKVKTGLGVSTDAWVAPYWTIDASFSTMTFLLALEEQGIGALFFAHAYESELRSAFSIPDGVEILGVVAFGYAEGDNTKGRSSGRPSVSVDSALHIATW